MGRIYTVYHAEPVLNLISKYESGGDYNIVYGGIRSVDRPRSLTSMTIAQVMNWQVQVVKNGARSSAAGKYQIIRNTLRYAVEKTGISTKRKFDAEVQDELALFLLDQRGFQGYLNRKIDEDTMVLNLAKEWASLPVPRDMINSSGRKVKVGQSFYAGDGLNKAHASVDEVRQALRAARARFHAEAVDPAAPKTVGKGHSFNWIAYLMVALVVGGVALALLLKG